MNIILASGSPRRKELLKLITPHFTIKTSHVDETYDESLPPHEIVMYLSKLKASAIKKQTTDLIIGADTIVCLNEHILEKPQDEEHAYQMLKKLANKTHQVITGVTLMTTKQSESFYSVTDVTFNEMTDDEIKAYINTKEPFDKAGAYGIQGFASKYIQAIKGDYFTVVGLPVSMLYQKLKKYI